MATDLKLESAIFVTQQSLLQVGWSLGARDDDVVLLINGKPYATIKPDRPRPDLTEHLGLAADAKIGIRRTVLLDPKHVSKRRRLEVELVRMKGALDRIHISHRKATSDAVSDDIISYREFSEANVAGGLERFLDDDS